jgi:hypothetical protein
MVASPPENPFYGFLTWRQFFLVFDFRRQVKPM